MKILGRLVLFGVAVLLVGCSGGDGTSPSPSVSVSATPESPSPSPSPTSGPELDLDENQQAAADAVLDYFKIRQEISKDLNSEVQPLADITTGQVQSREMIALSKDREAGIVQTGNYRVLIIGADKVSDKTEIKSVTIRACSDSTGADLIDTNTGKSILEGDPVKLEWDIEMQHIGGSWRVAQMKNTRISSCP